MKLHCTLGIYGLAFCASFGHAQIRQIESPTSRTFAAKPTDAPQHLSPAQARSNMLARTGGWIVRPDPAAKHMLFLNMQKRVPVKAFDSGPDELQKILRLPYIIENRPSDKPVDAAKKALEDSRNAAVIVLGDDASLPTLLIAPEDRWAVLNVAPLAEPPVEQTKITERVNKELWRTFAFLMGAANSTFDGCLMKPVFSPQDIDSLPGKAVCPEPLGKIMGQMTKLGIKQIQITTYREAVEQGWAPAPTNTIQRAIWDDVKKK
jgi:hypothetical protein